MKYFFKPLNRMAVISVIAIAASQSQAMTIQDAVQSAVTTNPLIGEAASLRVASDKELREVRGQYLPSLDAAAGIGEEWTNSPQTRSRGLDSERLTRKESSAILRQRLFDGFETGNQVERQKALVRAAALQVYETSELLGLDAATAYLEVIRQQNLVELARSNLAYHEKISGDIGKRVDGGASDRTDLNLINARLAQVKSTLAQQVQNYQNSVATFVRIVGTAPENVTTPASVLSTIPQSRAVAVEMAVTQNPSVQVERHNVDAAEAAIDVARSRYYPSINFEGETAYNEDIDGLEGYDRQHRLMLRARWNLLNGGSNIANVSEQQARHTASRYRVDAVSRIAREEASQSWDAYESAVRQFKNLTQAAESNDQTVGDYRKQFDISKRTLLDLLDAQNEYFVTRGQMITAQLNMEAAGYRLLAVTGSLLKSLNVAPPRESVAQTEGFTETIFTP